MTSLEDWKHLAIAENQRARRNWRGLENDEPIMVLALKKEIEGTQSIEIFRQRIQNLHLDGLTPDEIATQLACPEAVVWRNLQGLYTVRENRLFDDYRQLRVDRVFALKKQGLDLPEIAEMMGFTRALLNKDMREMPQEQARTAVARKNTGRIQHG